MWRILFSIVIVLTLSVSAHAQLLPRARFAPATTMPKVCATCTAATCAPAAVVPEVCTPATTQPKAGRPTLAVPRIVAAPVKAVLRLAVHPLKVIAARRFVAQRRAIEPVRRVLGALTGRRMRYAG